MFILFVMHICVYVVYVLICVCISVCSIIFVCIGVHLYAHVFVVYICVCCVYVFVCMYLWYISVCLYVCAYVFVYMCVSLYCKKRFFFRVQLSSSRWFDISHSLNCIPLLSLSFEERQEKVPKSFWKGSSSVTHSWRFTISQIFVA